MSWWIDYIDATMCLSRGAREFTQIGLSVSSNIISERDFLSAKGKASSP
jgi:hypothetical protein